MFVVVWCWPLVGVFVFSVMWSELLMTSAISFPLWSSVYECYTVECAFIYIYIYIYHSEDYGLIFR